MYQIRGNCFETNSSSIHSLAILKNPPEQKETDITDGFYINKNGTWDTSDEDWYFGRAPFRIMSTFCEKVKYAWASTENEEVFDIVKELIPKIKKIKHPSFCGTDDYQLNGWLKKYNISLREFLTNNRYIVICDGDEYCIWEDMINCGIIKTDEFDGGRYD